MEHHCELRDDRLVIAINGVLTFDDHDRFRHVLNAIIDTGARQVEISLAGLKMLDSAGIGMLLLANDKAKKANRTLRLTGVTGPVADIIEIARVGSVIPVSS